jgi:hypothetical protein
MDLEHTRDPLNGNKPLRHIALRHSAATMLLI